jgi:hypothetical protein
VVVEILGWKGALDRVGGLVLSSNYIADYILRSDYRNILGRFMDLGLISMATYLAILHFPVEIGSVGTYGQGVRTGFLAAGVALWDVKLGVSPADVT